MPSRVWVKSTRTRWLEHRKAHAKRRPRPLAVLEVNCMSVSTGPERARQILRNAAKAKVRGLPVDVILGCEADDFDAADVLGLAWDVFHVKNRKDEHDGSFVAVHQTRGRLKKTRLAIGSDPLPGVLPARWIAVADIAVDEKTPYEWWFTAASGHAPPMRAWVKWPQFMARLRRIRADVAGADYNKLARAVAPALGRRVRAVHILGIAVRFWIPSSRPVSVDVNGDHHAVGVVLWPDN